MGEGVGAQLEVSASRHAFVQVDLGPSTQHTADEARFLDAAGEPVRFNLARTTVFGLQSSSVQWTSQTMKLSGGRAEVGSTAEGEYVCVLLNSGREVARIPIVFASEGVTIVRP